MSRSYRHTLIFNWGMGPHSATARRDKQRANGSLRAKTRSRWNDDILPVLREVSDIWTWAKDGKFYWTALKLDVSHNELHKFRNK